MRCLSSISNGFKKFGTFVGRSVLQRVGRHVNWIVLILLAILAISSICLVFTHIYLVFDKEPPTIFEWWPNLILGLFGTDAAKLKTDGLYAVIVTDMIAVCAFVFAVLPGIQAYVYKIKLKREVREAHGLQVFEVRNEGVDDLGKMLEFYERAEHIIVFCGDFDWLQPSNLKKNEKYNESSKRQKRKMEEMAEKMRDFVTSYASQEKITLVSSKSEDLVREGLSNGNNDTLFESLSPRFVFDAPVGIKCSLIEMVNEKYTFLYRSYSGDKRHLFNANIFTKGKESEELVSILQKLIDFGSWRNKAGEHLKTAEKIEPKKEQG